MVAALQFLKFGVISLALFSVSGCSLVNDGSTTIRPTTLSTFSADPDSELGSRNNPIALGDTVVVNDWRVQFTKVNRDALKLILEADPYSSSPSASERYLLVALNATYIGEESSEPNSDLRFKVVGSKGNTFSQSCGYFSGSFSQNGETFSGATVKGDLCFTVDADQITGATISVQGDYSTEDRKFMSLDSR
jgi:hypothetical protein